MARRAAATFASAVMVAAGAAAALVAGGVQAQAYPAKPIRMIVPFPGGGGSDSTARILVQRLSERLGQQIVIDNRTGAAGIIGTEFAARAAPDGYALLLGSASEIVMLPAVATNLSFDPLKDFVAIARVADVPLLPDVPTVAEAGVPGYEVTLWTGVFAPTGTPKDALSLLEREFGATVQLPETRGALAKLDSEAQFSGSVAFSAFMQADHARWVKLTRETGIRLEQ